MELIDIVASLMARHIGPIVSVQENVPKVLNIIGAQGLRFNIPKSEYTTQVIVHLPETDISLSVQTAAGVTHYPGVLCEVALLSGDGIVYVDALEYSDVKKLTEEEFVDELKRLVKVTGGKTLAQWMAEYPPEESVDNDDGLIVATEGAQ